jgi:hypothetical protein
MEQQNALMSLHAAIPVLRIFSAEQAMAFYLGYLGCTLDWERRAGEGDPLTAQVRRGALTLRLSERHEDGTPGALLVVPVTGLAELHAELLAKPYPGQRPVWQATGSGHALLLTDPFGNRLVLCEGQGIGVGEGLSEGFVPGATSTPQPLPLTRAQVRAEYLKARAEGTLPPSGEA